MKAEELVAIFERNGDGAAHSGYNEIAEVWRLAAQIVRENLDPSPAPDAPIVTLEGVVDYEEFSDAEWVSLAIDDQHYWRLGFDGGTPVYDKLLPYANQNVEVRVYPKGAKHD